MTADEKCHDLGEKIYAELVINHVKTQAKFVRRPCENSDQSELIFDNDGNLAELLEIYRDIASVASICFYE